MSVTVTYSDVNRAYGALGILVRGSLLGDGGKPYVPVYPIATLLKIKRALGVLRPLIEQLEELRSDLASKHKWEQGQPVPHAMEVEFSAALAATCEVGIEDMSTTELIPSETAPASIVAVLMDLEPFLTD